MPRRQRGQALIAITVLLGITLLVTVYAMIGPINQTTLDDQKTERALALAKAALIGWAVSNPTIPGSFPCPDLVTNIPSGSTPNVPDDGNADNIEGTQCPSYIGRLPWKTLGLPDLHDGSNERLWYALSPYFRNDSSAQPINSDTTGDLSIVNNTAGTSVPIASGVVAIIFAPGAALGGQSRDTAGENTVANYLDEENADGDNTYAIMSRSSTFNDQLVWIGPSDFFNSLTLRVAREIKVALDNFRVTDPAYPYAAPDQSGDCPAGSNMDGWLGVSPPLPALPCAPEYPSWIADSQWYKVTRYHRINANKVRLSFDPSCISSFEITWHPGQNQSTLKREYPCAP